MDSYLITLKYYQAGVLSDTYSTQYMIANEPDLDLQFGRNEQFENAFQEFSGLFTFIKADRSFIIAKRLDYLSRLDADTKITIQMSTLNTVTLDYDVIYDGVCNMKDIEIQPYYVDVQFSEDNTLNSLDNVQDVEVSIEKDGNAYLYEIPLSAKLNSTKEVYYADNSSLFSTIGNDYQTVGAGDRLNEPSDTFDGLYADSGIKLYLYPQTKRFVLLKDYYARVIVNYDTGTPDIGSQITVTIKAFVNYDDGGSTVTQTIATETTQLLGPQQVIDLSVDDNYEVVIDDSRIQYDELNPNDGSYVTIITEYNLQDSTGNQIDTEFAVFGLNDYRLGCYCTFEGYTVESVIFANTFEAIRDDLAAELGITIDTSSFAGTPYENMLVTTSRGIKGIRPLTYNIKFSDWYNSLKSFMALSLRFSGTTIYLEPIENAYPTSTFHLGEATDLQISQNEKVFNIFDFGNSGGGSSNFDYGDLDYLAKRTYKLGINDDTKEELTNSIRVDAATINSAAIDYERAENNIEDRDEDKDIYFIAYDTSESTLKSNFTLSSGLDTEKFGEAINMEFAGSRQLYNWRNYYGHLFTVNSEFTLSAWEKNRDLIYVDTDRSVTVTDAPDTIDNTEFSFTPIFGASQYSVTIPITNEIYTQLKTNPNIILTFDFDGVTYSGYLKSVGTNPLLNKSGEIELIQSA